MDLRCEAIQTNTERLFTATGNIPSGMGEIVSDASQENV